MTEERKKELLLAEADNLRKELHSIVDRRVDAFILAVLHGGQINELQSGAGKLVPLASAPSAFKGTKPAAVIYPDGRKIETPTWRKAVAEILRDCNSDPVRHERMMAMRDRVTGNFRTLISESPDNMSAPLKIDAEMYLEMKFDTEALLRNIIQKILDPVGYEYRGIVIQYRPMVQEANTHIELESSGELDGIEHTGGMTFG